LNYKETPAKILIELHDDAILVVANRERELLRHRIAMTMIGGVDRERCGDSAKERLVGSKRRLTETGKVG
jgi:hypothetical protein